MHTSKVNLIIPIHIGLHGMIKSEIKDDLKIFCLSQRMNLSLNEMWVTSSVANFKKKISYNN